MAWILSSFLLCTQASIGWIWHFYFLFFFLLFILISGQWFHLILVSGYYMQLLGSDSIQIYQTCNGMRSTKAAWIWRFAWATRWYGSFILPNFAVDMLESSTKKWIFSSFINQGNMSCIWMAIFPSRSSEGNILWLLYVSLGKVEKKQCIHVLMLLW